MSLGTSNNSKILVVAFVFAWAKRWCKNITKTLYHNWNFFVKLFQDKAFFRLNVGRVSAGRDYYVYVIFCSLCMCHI